ncbi:hypothetical protein [Sorangium sp. So ce341]
MAMVVEVGRQLVSAASAASAAPRRGREAVVRSVALLDAGAASGRAR